MVNKTIGNPLSWSAQRLAGIGHGIGTAADGIASHDMQRPRVRDIGIEDIRIALRKGVDDFVALRSDVMLAVVLYPLIGLFLAAWVVSSGQYHALFPLLAGFPLVGPVAAVGLYEMSRRRERGEPANWAAILDTLRGAVLGPVILMACLLGVVFFAWLYSAAVIWQATLGSQSYDSFTVLLSDVFNTAAGWRLLVIGTVVGFVLATLALCISIVTFPMLLDRRVGVPVALATSMEVVRRNPATVALWGLIVALTLAIGMIPLFVGLIIALPILGHASWHLYRAAVAEPVPFYPSDADLGRGDL